ncbi:hypothetical protein D3C78_985620 [compost metagenome]
MFNPGQVVLYHLETQRVVDELQRDMAVEVLARFLQPVLGQLLTAKHGGGVLQGLRVLEGDSTLLLIQPYRLGFFRQALDRSDGLPCDALNQPLLHVQIRSGKHVPDIAQVKTFLRVPDDQHARITLAAM